MSDSTLPPVAIGIITGVGLIALFIVFSPQLSVEPTRPIVDGTIWVARNTTQCADPWHEYYHDGSPPLLKPNQTLIDYFFEEKGIEILDREVLPNPDQSGFFCEACGCSNGSTLYVRIKSVDVVKLSQFGFIALSPQLPSDS